MLIHSFIMIPSFHAKKNLLQENESFDILKWFSHKNLQRRISNKRMKVLIFWFSHKVELMLMACAQFVKWLLGKLIAQLNLFAFGFLFVDNRQYKRHSRAICYCLARPMQRKPKTLGEKTKWRLWALKPLMEKFR